MNNTTNTMPDHIDTTRRELPLAHPLLDQIVAAFQDRGTAYRISADRTAVYFTDYMRRVHAVYATDGEIKQDGAPVTLAEVLRIAG